MDFFFFPQVRVRNVVPCLEFSACPLSEPLKGLPVWGVQPSTLRQFCSEKEVKSFGSHFTLLEQFREGTFLLSQPQWVTCNWWVPIPYPGEKAHINTSKKKDSWLRTDSLTSSHTVDRRSRGVTQHAAEDSGIWTVPAVITDCPPCSIIEDFSSASVPRADNPDW